MKKRIELPLVEPLYKTYHHQGPATAIIPDNPSIRNWYLNESVNLVCTRRFLQGYTSPEISIELSDWMSNPYFEQHHVSSQFTKGYILPIIREMIDHGLYVIFSGVDDYYVKGKSWYKERHFSHDGMICGYDQNNKSYCVYAYDDNWVYRKFWTPQKAFYAGIAHMQTEKVFSGFCGLKVKEDVVSFSPQTAYAKIKEYLDSDLIKYPFAEEGCVLGIAVHRYIAEYILKLHKGQIPYERMDRRVFRLLWEHKKAMLERIVLLEQELHLDNEISCSYKRLVLAADTMRMMYASHHMKRRDSILLTLNRLLLKLMEDERGLLTQLVWKAERELENEVVEVS